MVQSLDIRSDGYYLIWFFTPLRVKYDWGFRLFDDGLVMENIYQKLHLAYLKFMSLITFNIYLRNSAKGGELFGGSLLQNFIKSDKNKIIPFYHNDMVWLINLFSFRGELRGWKAKHETQKRGEENKRNLFTDFIRNAIDCCERADVDARVTSRVAREWEKENFGSFEKKRIKKGGKKSTARYDYDSIDIHDGSWLSPIENSWAINGPEGKPRNWFFQHERDKIKYWHTFSLFVALRRKRLRCYRSWHCRYFLKRLSNKRYCKASQLIFYGFLSLARFFFCFFCSVA